MVNLVISMYGCDFLSTRYLEPDQVWHIIQLAHQIEKNPASVDGKLNRKKLASLFFEPSTRTRLSTETAAINLGAKVNGFSGIEGTSVKKGECLAHTIRMVEGYGYDAIAIRHPLQGSAQHAADVATIPVINCGDGGHEHPTQAMLDFLTLHKEFTIKNNLDIDKLKIAFAGDLKNGRTVHSNLLLLSHFPGVELHFVAPDIVGLPTTYKDILSSRGIDFYDHGTELASVIKFADAVYMTRVQEERFGGDTQKYLEAATAMRLTLPMVQAREESGLVIMHPLPINKFAGDISSEVDSLEQAKYFDQAANGLPLRTAILYAILDPIRQRATDEAPKPENLETCLKKVRFKKDNRPKKQKGQRLGYLDQGTVFDHIPSGWGYTVMKLIRRAVPEEQKNQIEYAGELQGRSGLKDIVKTRFSITDQRLLAKIAMVSEDIRMSEIHDKKVRAKYRLSLPLMLTDVAQCPNPKCITAPEHRENSPHMSFYVDGSLRCRYCDTVYTKESVLKRNDGLVR